MTRIRLSAPLVLTVLAVAASGAAPPDGSAPAPADRREAREAPQVAATVRALFDAMRARDTAAMRALVHPETRLARPVSEGGEVSLSLNPVDAWIEAVGGSERVPDERVWDLEVRMRGDLATAWMEYALYLDGRLSHCGVNAFHLFRRGDGWKVFHVSDVARTEGCEVPEELRPGG